MKNLVVYKSVSGFTRKYAEWLASELNADLTTLEEMAYKDLHGYDFIAFGGSLHAVGINGFRRFKKELPALIGQGKKVAVFCVGASPPKPEVLEEVGNKNFKGDEGRLVPLFYLRGGFDYSKLDPPNKFIMGIMKFFLSRKKNPSPDEAGMLSAYAQPIDFCEKKNLKEILDYAKLSGAYPPA